MIADALLTFVGVLLTIEAVFVMLVVTALIGLAAQHLWRRLFGCFLLAMILTSCATPAPRVITLPASCPAPRDAPVTRPWPPSLPALELAPGADPAQAILINRKDAEAQYEGLLKDFNGLMAFIRNENAVSSPHP